MLFPEKISEDEKRQDFEIFKLELTQKLKYFFRTDGFPLFLYMLIRSNSYDKFCKIRDLNILFGSLEWKGDKVLSYAIRTNLLQKEVFANYAHITRKEMTYIRNQVLEARFSQFNFSFEAQFQWTNRKQKADMIEVIIGGIFQESGTEAVMHFITHSNLSSLKEMTDILESLAETRRTKKASYQSIQEILDKSEMGMDKSIFPPSTSLHSGYHSLRRLSESLQNTQTKVE